jgi:tRNA-Thr(GGU) m(6)t(6)A37 methyltransferase TsaA
MPIQPRFAEGAEGEVEVYAEFVDGLTDLDGFSHIHLIYHLHCSTGYELRVVPYMDTELRGLFATRAPRRPNPIGLSVVRLLAIAGSCLRVADLDVLDGTPVLDIKPFNPAVDHRKRCRVGWMEGRVDRGGTGRADGRFDPGSGSSPALKDS